LKRMNVMGALALSLALQTMTGSDTIAAGDRIYRWTDAEGNQVNSDVPPPVGVAYDVISTDSSMVRSVAADEESASIGEEGQSEEKPAAPVDSRRVTIEKNPEYCAQAKNNLTQLDTRARIRLMGDDGKVRYLDEQERAVEREKALAAIEAYCE